MKTTAYLFAGEVDRQIEALSDEDYLKHRNHSKVIQEELLPISRLALHLKQPGLEVEVESFENDGEADGYIRVTGFRETEFNVQVTCDFSYEESMRRELMIAKGTAPGVGDIYREKKTKQIVATMAAADTDEHISRVSQSVVELYKKKAAKTYSKDTVLIIAFDSIKLYSQYNWNRLFASLEKEKILSEGKFMAIYLFNSATNELYRAT
jgi:hypothetical protein